MSFVGWGQALVWCSLVYSDPAHPTAFKEIPLRAGGGPRCRPIGMSCQTCSHSVVPFFASRVVRAVSSPLPSCRAFGL